MPVARSGLDAVPANGFRIQRSKNFSYGGGSIAQDRPVHFIAYGAENNEHYCRYPLPYPGVHPCILLSLIHI